VKGPCETLVPGRWCSRVFEILACTAQEVFDVHTNSQHRAHPSFVHSLVGWDERTMVLKFGLTQEAVTGNFVANKCQS
jgi:hypothetical protein